MGLPELTSQQRADALAKAAAARRHRAEFKSQLKYGQLNLKDVLRLASTDDVLGKMRVSALLESLPGVGKVKAQKLMAEIGIAESRRIRGLGPHQEKALLERFNQ